MSYEIVLAPLQGYTDAIFRDVYFRHFSGVDKAMAPFISTMGQQRINLSSLKDVDPENNRNCHVIPQILGNVADDFLFLARNLTDLGYDTVNWNMGCPHSKIAKKKRGSGMLPWPEMVDLLLYNVFKGLTCKLSVKVRLGRHHKDEIFDLLPVFEKYPLDEIIVHPRTGVQMYGGSADIDAFIKIAANTSHRLVYNGDITTVRFFDNIISRISGCKSRFMIGRGILSNPFLPSEIKGETRIDDLERIKLFHDELFETYSRKFYGPLHVTGRMKGFWTYIGSSFPYNGKEVKKILKSKSREHYAAMAESFFSGGPVFAPAE
ncbi:MAG: tRNA-dihydrouridine synthase family protein [Desulfamplus sp.]|nr:tRNA-dihydrouridine synthase family protein [Desulfamplus sp.]